MFPNTTKVLIIDDMLAMRKIIRKCLVELGLHDITEADDGATAWPLLEKAVDVENPFQLVISDWNMPKIQGIELLKKVRASEGLRLTPFILLTAESERTQVVQALQAGVTNYIMKPFTPQILAEKLKQAWIDSQRPVSSDTTAATG